jgi:fucose permease
MTTFTGDGRGSAQAYRRDPTTWAAFGALFAFGFLNAVLGPALPYLRAVEHISYLIGAFHQVAFALGSGLAAVLAARERNPVGRVLAVAGGLTGAGLAGLGVGYGSTPVITIAAATMMGLLATTALIRLWAALADIHGLRRAVAMTEGEVSVSLAGILTPLLISALAATVLNWRFAFVLGAGVSGLAALWAGRAQLPPASSRSHTASTDDGPARRWPQPTLIVVFAIVALEFALSFWLASYLNDDIGLARAAAVAAVSELYAAGLTGRVLASRLARRVSAERLLAAALAITLAGLPALLAAANISLAAVGIAVAGIGIATAKHYVLVF